MPLPRVQGIIGNRVGDVEDVVGLGVDRAFPSPHLVDERQRPVDELARQETARQRRLDLVEELPAGGKPFERLHTHPHERVGLRADRGLQLDNDLARNKPRLLRQTPLEQLLNDAGLDVLKSHRKLDTARLPEREAKRDDDSQRDQAHPSHCVLLSVGTIMHSRLSPRVTLQELRQPEALEFTP